MAVNFYITMVVNTLFFPVWANSGYLFNNTVFPGVNHAEIVSSKAVLESIAAIVGAPIDPINNHGITHIATVQLLGAVILLSQFLGF